MAGKGRRDAGERLYLVNWRQLTRTSDATPGYRSRSTSVIRAKRRRAVPPPPFPPAFLTQEAARSSLSFRSGRFPRLHLSGRDARSIGGFIKRTRKETRISPSSRRTVTPISVARIMTAKLRTHAFAVFHRGLMRGRG